ncbi:MAG TPA: hypothetical protein VD766_08025 [Solirubrobacterales bacterium]|nr:hypothetical protein [Solirubrobacterales bacterium]
MFDAQTASHETEEPEAVQPEIAVEDLAAAESADALAGSKLDEMGGSQVGRVEGSVTGRIEWLIARMGRFGHNCLVPARDSVTANGRVWVPYSRDQIRRAPRVDAKAPLDAELEASVLAHYGLEPESQA